MTDSRAGHRERLRQKFLTSGFVGMHDYEQLELILSFAIVRRDVKPLAKELLKQFKTIAGVLDAPIDELEAIPGLGMTTIVLLKSVREISTEYLKHTMFNQHVSLCTPNAVRDFARMKLGARKDEAFMAIFLNIKNVVIDYEIVSAGTIDHTVVYPRNIMKTALLKDASALIVVHNHPSGDCTPSRHDITLTEALKKAAETVNIRLLDHLIVCKSSSLSFIDRGLL